MPDKVAELTPYRRVKAEIASRIASGALKPGDRLESEPQMARRMALSRMTIGKALSELEREGAIARVQGIGTFVSQRKSEVMLVTIHSIAEEVRAAGQSYACRVVKLRQGRAGKLGPMLGLKASDPALFGLFVHLADGHPMQVEERVVNPAFAPDFLAQDFTNEGPYPYLMSRGYLQGVEHVAEAALPTAEVASYLGVSLEEPCMIFRRRSWTANRVATLATFTAPGRTFRVLGHFGTIPEKPPGLAPL